MVKLVGFKFEYPVTIYGQEDLLLLIYVIYMRLSQSQIGQRYGGSKRENIFKYIRYVNENEIMKKHEVVCFCFCLLFFLGRSNQSWYFIVWSGLCAWTKMWWTMSLYININAYMFTTYIWTIKWERDRPRAWMELD